MIPRRIVYCWYGGGEMSPVIRRCMATWPRVLEGYEIVRLDETKCDLNANAYVRGAAQRRRWALVSDYFRIAELYARGGVYLDTDIECFHPFNDLLHNRAFFGYMYDGLLSCGVLGFEAGHPLLARVLQLYEGARWRADGQRFEARMADGRILNLNSNNPLLTAALLEAYPDMKLDGRRHAYPDFEILPRQEFETGYVLRRGYCIHKAEASWRGASAKARLTRAVKRCAQSVPGVHLEALIRNAASVRHTRKCIFYDRYKRDGGRI